MAGSRIKGITVEIGGDTTGLDKALKSVNSTISVGGKMILPPHGKEFFTRRGKQFFTSTVRSFLHHLVSSFLHEPVSTF